ncbi:MAG TPA: Crp/Fnr family transcriptional regulator [Candidatus Acidoferrales bacterium]|jgi:CRP-like cAMP-binding protein|nr:Crp/Fnr family transcriptional regulator [Candidatus Acidoferrales bacterium]
MALSAVRLLPSGEPVNIQGHPVKNRLLRGMPENEFLIVRSQLKFLTLPNHMVLHKPKSRVPHVYFLNEGMISLVVECDDGRKVEVAVVGAEGASGVPAVVNLKTSPLQEIIQISGAGFRMEAAALQQCLRFAPQFRDRLNRYAVLQTMQIAQTAACNRLHEIQERLARWLLMTQDRVPSTYLPITHDFLAEMLGTDRPTVTLAAGMLQKKGAIQYVRGAIRIVHRNTLRKQACECYAAMEQFNVDLGLA